jgi:hypothetical protein
MTSLTTAACSMPSSTRTDDIWVMLLMNAFSDEQFLFMKETMYSKDLKDAFPKYAVILQDMQNYDLNRKKPTAKPDSTVPIGPTVLSTPSLNPSQTKCATCSKMFNTTIRHGGGDTYSHCFKCSVKAREAREAAAAHMASLAFTAKKLVRLGLKTFVRLF